MDISLWIKKLLIGVLLLSTAGCAGAREMTVTAKIKDGQYGIAKGDGYAVYHSKTMFCFLWFCKEIQVTKE